MRLVRRVLVALLALLFAVIGGAGLRLGGRGGTPPQHGGWRELELPPEVR